MYEYKILDFSEWLNIYLHVRFCTTRWHMKKIDKIFEIFRVKMGGQKFKTGQTDKFIKIRMYMSIPTHTTYL